jgi:hypothetical protein
MLRRSARPKSQTGKRSLRPSISFCVDLAAQEDKRELPVVFYRKNILLRKMFIRTGRKTETTTLFQNCSEAWILSGIKKRQSDHSFRRPSVKRKDRASSITASF